MNIYFIGHSSFLIKTSTGKRILTDPFDVDIGYKSFNSEVDLVTVSHLHFDHSHISTLSKDVKILQSEVCFENNFCKVTSFKSFHDNLNGQKRGPNLIFKIETDDIVLCHLGDLGHKLNSETINSIGKIDVLFVPVGEKYSIDIKSLKETIEQIHPAIIIPMHFKTKNLSFSLNPLDEFLLKMKSYTKKNLDVLAISADDLIENKESEILILDIFEEVN